MLLTARSRKVEEEKYGIFHHLVFGHGTSRILGLVAALQFHEEYTERYPSMPAKTTNRFADFFFVTGFYSQGKIWQNSGERCVLCIPRPLPSKMYVQRLFPETGGSCPSLQPYLTHNYHSLLWKWAGWFCVDQVVRDRNDRDSPGWKYSFQNKIVPTTSLLSEGSGQSSLVLPGTMRITSVAMIVLWGIRVIDLSQLITTFSPRSFSISTKYIDDGDERSYIFFLQYPVA